MPITTSAGSVAVLSELPGQRMQPRDPSDALRQPRPRQQPARLILHLSIVVAPGPVITGKQDRSRPLTRRSS